MDVLLLSYLSTSDLPYCHMIRALAYFDSLMVMSANEQYRPVQGQQDLIQVSRLAARRTLKSEGEVDAGFARPEELNVNAYSTAML